MAHALFFLTSTPYIGTIGTISIDGTDQQAIFSQNRAKSGPDWSLDGEEIVFMFHAHAAFSISVMDDEGGSFRQVTQLAPDQINASPAWSPDGRRVIFSSDRNDDHEIYVMDADGSQLRRITDDPAQDMDPAWRPSKRDTSPGFA